MGDPFAVETFSECYAGPLRSFNMAQHGVQGEPALALACKNAFVEHDHAPNACDLSLNNLPMIRLKL